MADMEKVIGHLNDCMEASRRDNKWVFVRKDIVEDALELLKDRAKDYEAWAKEIGVDTCVNCRHASWNRNDGTSTCPIEHNFALVKDGYCHLFIRMEGR